MAEKNSDRPVIFLGVGFETTAPAVAASILQARQAWRAELFRPLPAQIDPSGDESHPGWRRSEHFRNTGTGTCNNGNRSQSLEVLIRRNGVPVAVAGFEPVDILLGIRMLVDQVNEGRARVDNAYSRGVLPQGNRTALAVMNEVFEICDAEWRGFGCPSRERPAGFAKNMPPSTPPESSRSALRRAVTLRDVIAERFCGESLPLSRALLFGRACDPDNPVGPCMVSSEGACMAYYQFGDRHCED